MSHADNPNTVPVGACTSLVGILRAAAIAAPDAEALVHGDFRLSYREYWSSVTALAARLRSFGPTEGRVAVLLPNGIDICIASFGVQAAGYQLVPLNPLYTGHELRAILLDALPFAVIYAAEARATVGSLLPELPNCRSIELGDGMALRDCTIVVEPELPKLDPDRFAMLQYTGGTSGRPKGVNLTHRSLAANVAQREALLPTVVGSERVLAITPLYHAYATAMGLYLAANCRGTLVILLRYTPELALAAIARERVTLFLGAPSIYNVLVAHEATSNADLSSLRLCFSGAAPLSADTLRRWETQTGRAICEGYGMTEAGPVLTFNPAQGVRKAGSAGVPVPGTTLQIVDVETGTRVLPQGEEGEIRVRGPQVMHGYHDRADETAAALRDSWLYTGDIGALDEDGYLFIRDRKKEMVIVSGFNVYPREVEDALLSHPSVLEAAVAGRPDEQRGERLIAIVALKPASTVTTEELIQHIGGRLVRYKLPAEVRFVEALPKTAVGKVDKSAVKALVKAW
jgi:long-chain acyl-CoA synthetase